MVRFPANAQKQVLIVACRSIFLFILSCIVCFSFYNGKINDDNFNYGIEQINTYDASVFHKNMSVVDNGTSPRRFSNEFTAWVMSFTDGNWFEAAALMIRSNYLLYAAAISFLVYSTVLKHRPLMTVLLTASIMIGSLPSLSFDINGALDVFLGAGIPLAMIGITFALKREKNWDAAWLFASLAALMHVHEGIWGGFVIGVIWLATSLADGRIRWKELRAVPAYIAILLIICIPSLLLDEAVNPIAFQQIYVFWRTPHHFLLSNWGAKKIAVSSFFSLFPFVVGTVQLFPHRREAESRRKIFLFSSMTLLWGMILGIEYLSTEILTSSILITLYIPKSIKFIVFVAYSAYLWLAYEAYTQQKYLQTFFVLASLVVSREWAGVMLVLYFACWLGKVEERIPIFRNKNSNVLLEYLLLAILVLLALYFLQVNVYVMILCGILYLMELMKFCQVTCVRRMSSVIAAVGILLVGSFSLEGKFWQVGNGRIEWTSGQASIRATVGDEIYDLALDFQKQTDSATEFLADPYSSIANEIQIISQRNCYCLYKNTPSSKKNVIEWYDRIRSVEHLSECTDVELLKLMRELGLEYVLVSEEQLELLQQSELFEAVTQTEKAGIYRAV